MRFTLLDRLFTRAFPRLFVPCLLLVFTIALGYPVNAQAPGRPARIFVLMVWDGLRPDSVTAERTPNLFAMGERRGAVRAPSFGLSDDHDGQRGDPGDRRVSGQHDGPPATRCPCCHGSAHREITPATDDSWVNGPVNLRRLRSRWPS